MEMARCSTSLMASRLPARPPSLPRASLAASSSVFFTNGGNAVVGGRLAVVAGRRRRASGGLGCRCLFGLGVPELVVIAGVAALVFGPKKLPEIGRSIGKTVKSFQQLASVLLAALLSASAIFCFVVSIPIFLDDPLFLLLSIPLLLLTVFGSIGISINHLSLIEESPARSRGKRKKGGGTMGAGRIGRLEDWSGAWRSLISE